jgi:hypothetical protein
MKKIFLILLVLLAGISLAAATASPAHPPGGMALYADLSGYGMDNHAVTPDTVLAVESTVIVLALPDYINDGTAGQRDIKLALLDTGQGLLVSNRAIDYPLRL